MKKEKYNLFCYLESKNISKQLSVKSLKYLDFIHQEEESLRLNSGQEILNRISENLKKNILEEYYGKILENNKIFK